MNYRLIIQELKASPDHNVKAFVRDVENMKRLTTQKRHHYLMNRQEPGAVRTLVNDYIPYIISVAYGYSGRCRKLSVLDLVNEGILGAYAAFENNDGNGKSLSSSIRNYINSYISHLVEMNGCSSESDFFTHERDLDEEEAEDCEEAIIKGLDQERECQILNHLFEKEFWGRYTHFMYLYYVKQMTLRELSESYAVGVERVRQMTELAKKHIRRYPNLWSKFADDFYLPIDEASFKRNRHY